MSSSRQPVQHSRVSFHPIIQIDPSHRAAEAARRPQALSVTFAPFVLPSINDPGAIDDSITTDQGSSEEGSSEEGSSEEDSSSDEDSSHTDNDSTNSTCHEASSSRGIPVAKVTNSNLSTNMPFFQNPLAYPRRTPSALAARAESTSLRDKTSNTRSSARGTHEIPSATPTKSSQGIGPKALLQGAHSSQSRAAKGCSNEPAAHGQESNVINLISDDEEEDKPPSTRQSKAAPSSSHKPSPGFILNKSAIHSPLPLLASSATSHAAITEDALRASPGLTAPSFTIAQDGQTTSSPAPETSSYGSATFLSKPRQSYPKREEQGLQTPEASLSQPMFLWGHFPYIQLPPTWPPAWPPTWPSTWPPGAYPVSAGRFFNAPFAGLSRSQFAQPEATAQLPWAQMPVAQPVQAFAPSSFRKVTPSPADTGGEDDTQQPHDELLPQGIGNRGLKQKHVVASAEKPVVATPEQVAMQLRGALQDNVLQPHPTFAARKDFDLDPKNTNPTAQHNSQSGDGPTGSSSGFLSPGLAAGQYHHHGLPSPPCQFTDVEKATSLTKPPPPIDIHVPTVLSGVKNWNSQTPTTRPAVTATSIIGRDGSLNSYGAREFDTLTSKASRRGTASARDPKPGRDTYFNIDLHSDTDDNDNLADSARFTRRVRGQPARQSSTEHRVSHPAGPNRGEQDKRTRLVTSTKDQGKRGEKKPKKTVQPSAQHTEVDLIGPRRTNQDSRPGKPVESQRTRLQAASSSSGTSSNNTRRPGVAKTTQDVVDNINTFQHGGRWTGHVSGSRETQEMLQPTKFRKRKIEQTKDIGETHEQTMKKRARLDSQNRTENKHNLSQGNEPKYHIKREANDSVVAGNDGADDYFPCTPSSTAGSSTTIPTSQRGNKGARSCSGLKPPRRDASCKRPRTQRVKPASLPKQSKIVDLYYSPANLRPQLRRIMAKEGDPKEPVESKYFPLKGAQWRQGAGFFEVPLEVRQAIYRYLLVAEEPIEVQSGWSEVRRRQGLDLHPTILRSCRQIHDEATEVLYSENSFRYVLRDDAKMVALAQGGSWQLIMPLDKHIHHFRNLELVLERSGIEKEEYTRNIYKAIRQLNRMHVKKLKKLTIVTRPHIETDSGQASTATYFQSNNNVIKMLKELRTEFIQIDVHLPKNKPETAKSIRVIIDKRVEVAGMEIPRQMNKQTNEEKELDMEERRRLAEAQLAREAKEAVDAQLNRLGTRIQNACTKGAAWVLKRGWFTEFESDAVAYDDYMDFGPREDTEDSDWEGLSATEREEW